MRKSFPLGVAQRKVVEALGVADTVVTNWNWDDAEAFFAHIGISVTPVRVGRTSEPYVSRRERGAGGFTPDGDGDVVDIQYEAIDLTPLRQWMRE